jgi:hypothetical protein
LQQAELADDAAQMVTGDAAGMRAIKALRRQGDAARLV